jgi:hypothetical protein
MKSVTRRKFVGIRWNDVRWKQEVDLMIMMTETLLSFTISFGATASFEGRETA